MNPSVLLGAAWGVLVVVAAWLVRPAPARLRALAPEPARDDTRLGIATSVGTLVVRLIRRPTGVDPAALGRAVLVGLPFLVIAPVVAPVAALVTYTLPILRRRRVRRARAASVISAMPEVVDLFVLAVGAGLTVPLAAAAVARRGPEPIAGALARAVAEVEVGRRMAEALEEIPRRLDEQIRPLTTALVASERYGAPLLDTLERLAVEVRATRRRRAEEAARRVPVKLLFPLVFCTLPAFALLTVAPLVAGALGSLAL